MRSHSHPTPKGAQRVPAPPLQAGSHAVLETHESAPHQVTSQPPEGAASCQATHSHAEALRQQAATPSRKRLTKLMEERGTSPQYCYTEDGSSGQLLHKCTIKTDAERINGGGYYGDKSEATEQASCQALKREYARLLISRSTSQLTTQCKERLKQHVTSTSGREKAKMIKYETRESSRGYKSKVFAPGLGYAEGEIGGSRREAEEKAALAALIKLRIECELDN